MKSLVKLLMVLALGAIICLPGVALGDTITVSVDENGNGFTNYGGGLTLPYTTTVPDPGPGGLSLALTYTLPFPVVAGDVFLSEPVLPGDAGAPSDLVRFNTVSGVSTLVFYSDQDDPILSLADTGLPSSYYTNNVTIPEVGPEGNNGANYSPTSGGPGDAGFAVEYQIISDVPLPPTALLLGTGLVGLVGLGWRRRRG